MRWPRRVLAVARKELRVLLRDRFFLFLAVGLPVFFMLVLGYGINYDVKNLPLGVADLDRSAESRELVDAFTASGYFRQVLTASDPADMESALEAGRIRVVLVIPSGMTRTLHRGRPAEVQVSIDGSFSTRAEIAYGYVQAVTARFSQEHLAELAQRAPEIAARGSRLRVESRVWFNPTLESKNFIVPGMVALSLLFAVPLLTALSVTREKETGAILNVQTAPLARVEYVAGKLLPYAVIAFVSYWLLLLASLALFRVPLRGSITALTTAALLYVLGLTGLGLLVSMLVRTQVAALLVVAVLVMIIGTEYSGWAEPLSTFDAGGRLISRLLPTADFMTVARGVYLKGLGFGAYGRTVLSLGLYALVVAMLSVLAFRKRRR